MSKGIKEIILVIDIVLLTKATLLGKEIVQELKFPFVELDKQDDVF